MIRKIFNKIKSLFKKRPVILFDEFCKKLKKNAKQSGVALKDNEISILYHIYKDKSIFYLLNSLILEDTGFDIKKTAKKFSEIEWLFSIESKYLYWRFKKKVKRIVKREGFKINNNEIKLFYKLYTDRKIFELVKESIIENTNYDTYEVKQKFGLLESFLQKKYKTNFKEFRKNAKKNAKQSGIELSNDEIRRFYYDINEDTRFIDTFIKANAEGVNLDINDAKKIFRKAKTSDRFTEVVEHYLKTTREDTKLSLDDYLQLIENEYDYKLIVNELIKIHNTNTTVGLQDVNSLFKNNKDRKTLLSEFVEIKKSSRDISEKQLNTLFIENIPTDTFFRAQNLLHVIDLNIPFDILLSLLKTKADIINCYKILLTEKAKCIAVLRSENIVKQADKLANTFIIFGAEKFSSEFNRYLLSEIVNDKINIETTEINKDTIINNLTEAKCKQRLSIILNKSKAFKITLNTIFDYLKPDTKTNVCNTVDAYNYIATQRKDLKYSFDQLAELSTQITDVHEYMKSIPKNGNNNRAD